MSRRAGATRREEHRDEINTIIRNAELLHEHGLSLPTRLIYMGSEWVDTDGGEGGTDAKMAEAFVKNMHILEQIGTEPINIIANNLGGDEYHGAAMFDAILQSPCKTIITVRGHAMSMGSIILQAANERLMGPTATQMIHYGTWGTHHHSKTAQKHAQEGLRWDLWMEDLYMRRIREKNPQFPLKKLREMLDHDTYLTPEQSIALGLADAIG